MRDKLTYEWVAEDLDEYGDIIDSAYSDILAKVIAYHPPATNVEYALMRRYGNDEDGESYREYVYIKDGKLPVEFPDGYKVPARFQKELALARYQ